MVSFVRPWTAELFDKTPLKNDTVMTCSLFQTGVFGAFHDFIQCCWHWISNDKVCWGETLNILSLCCFPPRACQAESTNQIMVCYCGLQRVLAFLKLRLQNYWWKSCSSQTTKQSTECLFVFIGKPTKDLPGEKACNNNGEGQGTENSSLRKTITSEPGRCCWLRSGYEVLQER